MSTIKDDFDRIALATLASEDGAAHHDHYHNFLLRHLPSDCRNILEIGSGTGSFARRLAARAGSAGILPALSASDRSSLVSTAGSPGSPAGQPGGGAMLPAVLALDLSPEMIRIARERSTQFPNIEFQLADVRELSLPDEHFDCIASIATLHHYRLPRCSRR
jgi:ubiquinone/menaquinone biosynthesis C-methylase UbiE